MAYCNDRNRFGEPCSANAIKGSDKCFMHDPRKRGKAQEARKKGGRHRTTPPAGPAPEVDISTVAGIAHGLAATIRDTWMQSNSNQRSKTLGSLYGVALQVFQLGDDVAALRAFVEEMQQREGKR
jgi:hypothetical protein